MYWQWNSQKGSERKSNNDAVGVINGTTFFFAIVVDAAEKSDKSNQFACYWAETIASSVLIAEACPLAEDLLDILRNTQQQLRHQFLHEAASYIALIYNKNTQEGQVLVCGDCRLGLVSSDIKWLTKTHTLLTAFDDSLGDVKKDLMTRHTLTHSLNAKRFIQPEVITVDDPKDGHWILCTDGYWAEYIEEETPWEQLRDDASCLTISMSELPSQLTSSDCDNYFSYELECDE